MRIDDGKGSGKQAAVSSNNKLETEAVAVTKAYQVAKDDKESYNWVSLYSAATGEEIIYIKNTHASKNLYIDLARVSSVNTCLFSFFKVTSGTPAGTTITGVNMSLSSNNAAQVTSYGNASVTGSVAGSTFAYARTTALGESTILFNGILQLGQNDAFAVSVTQSTGIVDITIRGFFDA